ncbi:MAG: trehalose-phosphatase [Bacillota bacterium]
MKQKVKYLNPNSPENWPEKLKTNMFQLFLDYDGTLAPFKDDPDKAHPVNGTNQIISNFLKKNIPVTIVTGRSARDIRNKFIKPEIPIIGRHGREFLPAEQNNLFKIGPKQVNIPDKIIKYINQLVNQNPVELEEKENARAIHLKNNDNLQESIYKRINNKLEEYNFNDWEVISGRKVIEIRYSGWNKADAVNKYRIKDKLVIYIGDDRTDEDVFENLSEPGLTIYIKNEDAELKTKADYYLENPSETIKFLNALFNFMH